MRLPRISIHWPPFLCSVCVLRRVHSAQLKKTKPPCENPSHRLSLSPLQLQACNGVSGTGLQTRPKRRTKAWHDPRGYDLIQL